MPIIIRGAREANVGAPAPGADLVVTAVNMSPAAPVPGDHVVFSATVQNVGALPTPAGLILDCVFIVDGSSTTNWSDTNTSALAPGASVVLTANSGNLSVNYWTATAGSHTVQAGVNFLSRIPEANRANNTTSVVFNIGAASTKPNPPVLQTATAGNNRVDLAYSTPADGGSPLTVYAVLRASGGGAAGGIAFVAPGTNTYADTTALNGTAYTYTITASNDVGTSDPSNAMTRTPFASGSIPTLPANAVVGTSAWRELLFGNATYYSYQKATWDTWAGAGAAVGRGVGGVMPISGNINSTTFRGSANPGNGNQHSLDPVADGGLGRCDEMKADGMEVYPKFYFRWSTPASPSPLDIWNDTNWAAQAVKTGNIAACTAYVGAHGQCWDLEGGPGPGFELAYQKTLASSSGKTDAQIREQIRSRGQQIATTMWTAHPTMRLCMYSFVPETGYHRLQTAQIWGHGATGPYPNLDSLAGYWLLGLFDGMRAAGGNGEIVILSHVFYRPPLFNDTYPGSYKLNSQDMRGYWAQPGGFTGTTVPPGGVIGAWPQASLDFALHRLRIVGFTWLGVAPPPFYVGNDPTPSTWSTMRANARIYSEGSRMAEYTKDDGSTGQIIQPGRDGDIDALLEYQDPVALNGAIAAANQAPVPNAAAPTITNISAVRSGSTATISCRSAHLYGVAHVRVYNGAGFNPGNPEANFIHTMPMTWQKNGGSWTTNFDAAYMQCTLSGVPCTAGQWFVLKSTSIKDDVRWDLAQAN